MKKTVEQAFRDAGVVWFDSDFKDWFFPMEFKVDGAVHTLTSQKLPRAMTSEEIQKELKPGFVTLEEIAETLKTLDHSTWCLFYTKDKDDVPRLVRAHWGDGRGGWRVCVDGASHSDRWGGGRQLFSSNSRNA